MNDELAPYEERPGASLIRPLGTPEEARAALDDFEALKRALLVPSDYQAIGGGRFIKRSGWRRIAVAFGIDCTILHEERRELGDGRFVWEIRVRATAPNGRRMDATGSCSVDERRFAHPQHDVRAVAETRAKNRAIADLVAGGELSAEELDDGPRGRAPRQAQPRSLPPPVAGDPTPTQLAQLRQHLDRTGRTVAWLASELEVEALDQMTSTQAAAALRRLSREPNA